MEPETFRGFQSIAREVGGIFLRPGKSTLVQARLAKRLRELGLGAEREYLDVLRRDPGEVPTFLDAISTNFTRFFREASHFDEVRALVEAARAAGQERFRFWC